MKARRTLVSDVPTFVVLEVAGEGMVEGATLGVLMLEFDKQDEDEGVGINGEAEVTLK